MTQFKWTDESALTEFGTLIGEIDLVANGRRRSARHVQWAVRTATFLEEVFGRNSPYYQTFISFPWERQGTVFVHAFTMEEDLESANQAAFIEQLDSARGLLQAAKGELERRGLGDVYQGKDTAPESSAIVKVLRLTEHKLRKTIRKEPANEREIQDAVENLLIASDVEFAKEVDRIEYSTKGYIPDFTLKKLDLAIEVKLCDTVKREKEMIAEINDDILAYKRAFGNVLFVVYDVGQIRDVERFKNHFEEQEQVIVQVVKH